MNSKIKKGSRAIEKQFRYAILAGAAVRQYLRLVTRLPFLVFLLLLWNYGDTSNIVFEVWQSTDLITWTELGETSQTQWSIAPAQQQQFFKVRARDTRTGLESFWATK